MRLQPLKQWICDYCHETIHSPKEGYLEWIEDSNSKYYGFKIVHHYLHSPKQETRYRKGCYHYDIKSDTSLESVVGPEGIVMLLSLIDFGPYHNQDYICPSIKNFREFVEIFRRLHIPYYEEARLYWEKALEDNYFESANEIWIYLPENLENLIKKYGNKY